MKQKQKQLNLRISESQRDEIKSAALNKGYKSMSKFIIDAALDKVDENKKQKTGIRTHIITIAPTIDYHINIDHEFEPVNRFYASDKEFILGGRGINSSLIMEALNKENITVHYSGGFIGEYIWNQLNELKIEQFRIKSPEPSRINVKLEKEGKDNIIFDQKPTPISEYGKEEILNYISKNVKRGEKVILAGSVIEGDSKFIKESLKTIYNCGALIYLNIVTDDIFDIIGDVEIEFVMFNKEYSKKIISKNKIINSLEKILKYKVKSAAEITDINYVYHINKEGLYFIETEEEELQSRIGIADAYVSGIAAFDELDIQEKILWASACMKSRSMNKKVITYEKILEAKNNISIK